MILLAGLPSEPPMALVIRALEKIGAQFAVLDQRDYQQIELSMMPPIGDGHIYGTVRLPDDTIEIDTIRAIYLRLHGEASFEELSTRAHGDPLQHQFRDLNARITAFADLCPGVVLNRSPGMATNNSKGFQSQMIADSGFNVPSTLVTNNPDRARAYIAELSSQGRGAIYKSASAVRSVVKRVTPEELARLHQLRICPVMFQELVPGTDFRVHVVGQSAFATKIETTGTDYRYAVRDGGTTTLTAARLPRFVEQRCIKLAQRLRLAFAGVDLRLTPEGEWVCFEVNPSPAFSYYEEHTGQPIADSVALELADCRMAC